MYIKKYYQIFEFIFIFSFLIVPPLLAKPIRNFNFLNPVSAGGLSYFLISLILYFQENQFKTKNTSIAFKFINNSAYFFKTFGSLVVFAATLDFLLVKTGVVSDIRPDFSNFRIVPVFFAFLITCFYEEIIYRLYLPSSLKKFIKLPKIPRYALEIFFEIVSVFIFAFSHRYLGWPAVVNAMFAGIVLRLCYLKSSSILTAFAAHFSYNFFMFLLYYFIQKYQ